MSKANDTARQVTVIVSAVIALAGALWGSGLLGGTQIAESAGGALTEDATTVAPAGPAFSIWSLIYAALLAYAVYQALPGQREATRHRRLGYPIAATMLLNAAWIASVQADLLVLSAIIIVVLLAVLGVTFALAQRHPTRGIVDAIVTDGTVGIYLGWITAATIANIAALLADWGYSGDPLGADGWGVALTAVAGIIGVAIAVASRGRLAPAAALAWALAWVAVGRFGDEFASTPTGITASIAAGVVVVVTVVIRAIAIAQGARRTTP